MPAKIPWEIIGPAGGLVIILLIIVFGFILKFQAKRNTTPAPPKDIQTMSKSSPCFRHERDIGGNTTAIGLIAEQVKISNENNRKDHKDLFGKMEDLKTTIIKEIHKSNDK